MNHDTMNMPLYIQRIACKAGLGLFPFLQIVSREFRKHPCYWHSHLLFYSLTPEQQKQCHINILLDVHPDSEIQGHCWLTMNGEPFGKPESTLKAKIECIGSRGLYDYWVVIPANADSKEC